MSDVCLGFSCRKMMNHDKEPDRTDADVCTYQALLTRQRRRLQYPVDLAGYQRERLAASPQRCTRLQIAGTCPLPLRCCRGNGDPDCTVNRHACHAQRDKHMINSSCRRTKQAADARPGAERQACVGRHAVFGILSSPAASDYQSAASVPMRLSYVVPAQDRTGQSHRVTNHKCTLQHQRWSLYSCDS